MADAGRAARGRARRHPSRPHDAEDGRCGGDCAILEKCPSARILILTTFVTSESIGKALRSGAAGAVQKNLSNVELLSAIRNVAAGKQVISSDIQETLTSDEIAKQYGITYDGVKSHLKVIFSKLGVTGRAEAISIALKKHLLKI